ncbi:MAG: nucleotidyltransferase domain-containing protein [Ignavibacteriales bacterium]|nr:nucleotidyltransferase domain-containing protein [Ignavibacteriales bacterium]
MVNRDVIEIVKKYLHEIESKGVHISTAYLYGSQTKGTAVEDSDIDLMLVSPLFDSDFEKYLPAIWFSKIGSEYNIEPFIVGEKRFLTDESSPIIGIVKREGIEIAA